MDPLSITTSATAILAICLQAVHLIQRTIETVKNARKLLVKLLAQTERLRLILEQLRCLTKQLGSRGGLLLSYNDSAPKTTIRDLNTLVTTISGKSNFVGIQMLLNKSKVDVLVEKMKKHEEEVVTVLLSIAATSAVRTENEVLQMHEESKAASEVLLLFEDFRISNSTTSSELQSYKPGKPLQIWFGDTYREGFSKEYLDLRDSLSDAAYRGDFDEVFRVLKIVEDLYGESWVNAPRLGIDPSMTSGWAPIHQSAFMCASLANVQQLLEIGASKTLRTNWTDANELLYVDLCALEIAQEHGYSHLLEILEPRIKNLVPHSALDKVQSAFHQLIKSDLTTFANQEHLRLPELAMLTDMEIPEMWFPLKSLENHPTSSRGYLYRLDGRELVVKAFGIRDVDDSRLYRISTTETREIIEGVIFDAGARKEKI